MRLKQYLRGLGIGIIVTALIIGISSVNQSNNITDEEIKAMASELGMMEETNSSEENMPEVMESTAEKNIEELQEESLNKILEEPSEEFQEKSKDDPLEELSEEIQEEYIAESQDESSEEIPEGFQNIVVVSIESGDSSNTVASELERLHVIDSASLFDEYLCTNEYSKNIRVGIYEVPMDSTYEQITSIICGVE